MGVTGARNLVLSPSYTPDGIVYELTMGRKDQFAEILVSTIRNDADTFIVLGNNEDVTGTGIYKDRYTTIDSAKQHISPYTVEANNRFIIDFDLWTALNENEQYNTGASYSFKEIYVPILVTTKYHATNAAISSNAYTEEYTLKLRRINDDNTLKSIYIETVDGTNTRTVAADYDNDYAKPKRLLDWVDNKNYSVDTYNLTVPSSQHTADITITATDPVAMVTTGVGVKAKDPAVGDPYQVNLQIDLTTGEEVYEVEIKVRAEENPAGMYKTSKLRIVVQSNNAELEDVFTVHPYLDDKSNPALEITTHGEEMPDADLTALGDTENSVDLSQVFDGGYDIWLSHNKATVSTVDLTAKAAKSAAKVAILPCDPKTIKTVADLNTLFAAETGTPSEATTTKTALTDGTTFAVRVESSDGTTTKYFLVNVHVVDLELSKVQVTAGTTVMNALILDDQGNVVMPPAKPASQIKQDGESVYYYVIVPAKQQTVKLNLEVHDKANAVLDWGVYDPENGLGAPMPNTSTSGPMIQVNTLTFPTSQKSMDIQMKVGRLDMQPIKVKDHFLRIFREDNSVDATVIVWYLTKEGKLESSVGTLYVDSETKAKSYRVYIPGSVTVADIEVIGSHPLSTVQLTPGMSKPELHKYTVEDVSLPYWTNQFDLTVTSMNGKNVGEYDVIIYRTDVDLEIYVDDPNVNLATSWKMMMVGKTETKVYEGMAANDLPPTGDGPTIANVQIKSATPTTKIAAGIPASGVEYPGSDATNDWTQHELDLKKSWPAGKVIGFTNAATAAKDGYEYTDIGIRVRGLHGNEQSILRIYQPNDNTKLSFTAEYTTDLHQKGTTEVYEYTDDNGDTCFELAIPNTAVSALITGNTQHPMAEILGALAPSSTITTDEHTVGSNELNVDLTKANIQSDSYGDYVDLVYHVKSTDGTKDQSYNVRVYLVDVKLKDVNVDTQEAPVANAAVAETVKSNGSAWERKYEQTVGSSMALNQTLTLVMSAKPNNGGATVRVKKDTETWTAAAPAASAWNDTHVMNGNAENYNMQVEHTFTLPHAKKDVTYTDDSILSVLRSSADTGLEKVELYYTDYKGVDRVLPAVRDKGTNNNFILYVPDDVEVGDLVFTATTEGSLISASTSTTAAPDYKYGKDTIKKLDLTTVSAAYANVASTNLQKECQYNVDIVRVNMNLLTVNVVGHNVPAAIETSYNINNAKNNKIEANAKGEPVYTGFVPNEDDTNQTNVDAYVKLQGNTTTVTTTSVNGSLTPVILAGLTGSTLAPYTDLDPNKPLHWDDVSWNDPSQPGYESLKTDYWKVSLGSVEKATMDIKLTVPIEGLTVDASSNPLTTDEAKEIAEQFTRNYHLNIIKTNGDVTLKNNSITLDYYEALIKNATTLDDMLKHTDVITFTDDSGKLCYAYTKYVPESTQNATVHVTANSSAAKVDVRLEDKELDYDKLDFSGLTDKVDTTFSFKNEETGELYDSIVVVIAIKSSAGTLAKYYLTIERVIKDLGTVKVGETSDVNSYLTANPGSKNSDVADNTAGMTPPPLYDYVAVEYWNMLDLDNPVQVDESKKNEKNVRKVYVGIVDSASTDKSVYAKPRYEKQVTLDVTKLKASAASFAVDDLENVEKDRWAKVTIKGVEDASADDEVKFNTEYVRLVPWNNNADLSKVTATVRVKGFTGDQGDVYTLPGIPQYNAAGNVEKYVVYVPTIGNGIATTVESITAVTDENDGKYAKVRVSNDPANATDMARDFTVHTDTFTNDSNGVNVTFTGNPSDDVPMMAEVLPTQNHYNDPATKWPIILHPIDMSLNQVQVSSNNLVPAKQIDADRDGQNGGPGDDQLRYEATIQPFRLLDAKNNSLEKIWVKLNNSDQNIKMEFGYLPIPASATDIPDYEGKYTNYLSSDTDVNWGTLYDQNSGMPYWDTTNGNYLSHGVDLYDGVDASTMVKIRVSYWLDLPDDTGNKVSTRVSYVDYSVNAIRMNDDARDLGIYLGLTTDEPPVDGLERYAIQLQKSTEVKNEANNSVTKYTYYYPIETMIDGEKNPYYDHDSSENLAYLDLEQLGTGKMTDLYYQVGYVQYDGDIDWQDFIINGSNVGDRMPPKGNGFDVKPEDFLNNTAGLTEYERPFQIKLTKVEDASSSNGNDRHIYTLVRVVAVSEANMTSQYDIKIYEAASTASLDVTSTTKDPEATKIADRLWSKSNWDNTPPLQADDELYRYSFVIRKKNVEYVGDDAYIPVDLVVDKNLAGLRAATIELKGTTSVYATGDYKSGGSSWKPVKNMKGDILSGPDKSYVGETLGSDGKPEMMFIDLGKNDIGYLYFQLVSEDGTSRDWYCVRITVQSATGDLEYIRVTEPYTGKNKSWAATIAVGKNGDELTIPAYDDGPNSPTDLNKHLNSILNNQLRADEEEAIMKFLVDSAVKQDLSEPPQVSIYRAFVTKDAADKAAANNTKTPVEVRIKPKRPDVTKIEYLGNSSTIAFGNNIGTINAGSNHVQVAVRNTMSGEDQVVMALPHLAGQTNPAYEADDDWLKNWPVEYLYFRTTTEGIIRYYVLELRILDTTDNRAIDYNTWTPEPGNAEDPGESFAVWVHPATEGDYTKTKPNVTVQYRKDDNNEYIYATDYMGNGLSTSGTVGNKHYYTVGTTSFYIEKNASGGYDFLDINYPHADVRAQVTTSTYTGTGDGKLLVDCYGYPLRIPGNVEGTKFQKYADGTAVLDAKGRYLPVELIATLDDTAQNYVVTAKTEFPFSGVEITPANAEGQNPGASTFHVGLHEYHATYDASSGGNPEYFINVVNSADMKKTDGEEYYYGPLQYHLMIETVKSDRALSEVRHMGAVDTYGNTELGEIRGGLLPKTKIYTVPDEERLIQVDVPYGMTNVDLVLVPNNPKAYVSMKVMGDNAQLGDVQLHENLNDMLLNNTPLTHVQGDSYVSLPFDMDTDEVTYHVFVGTKPSDTGAVEYYVKLKRKDNDLRLQTLTYNKRPAQKTALTATLEVDSVGRLFVDSKNGVPGVTLLGNGIMIGNSNKTGSSMINASYPTGYEYKVIQQNGRTYIYDGRDTQYQTKHFWSEITTDLSAVPVWSIDIPLNDSNTYGVIRAMANSKTALVDVHELVSKKTGEDSHIGDTTDPGVDMMQYVNDGDSIAVPIFISSSDEYDYTDGSTNINGLSDETQMALLIINRRKKISDLDVVIKVNHQYGHPESEVEASVVKNSKPDGEESGYWKPWETSGTPATFYGREAVIYSDALMAYVKVTANSSASKVTVYDFDGTPLAVNEVQQAQVQHKMQTDPEDNVLYIVVSTDDGNECTYKLYLIRNSGNTDLEFARTTSNEDNFGNPIGTATYAEGQYQGEDLYIIQLPKGTAQMRPWFKAVDKNAVLQVKMTDKDWNDGPGTSGKYNTFYKQTYLIGDPNDPDDDAGFIQVTNVNETYYMIKVTAPNGNYKEYRVIIRNEPSDASLLLAEVGYLNKSKNQLKATTITGQLSRSASITIPNESENQSSESAYVSENYMVIPVRFVATASDAIVELRDVNGNGYLNYKYNANNLMYELDLSSGDPERVKNDVILSSKEKGNSNTLNAQIVIDKKHHTTLHFEIVVRANHGAEGANSQVYQLEINCNRGNFNDLQVEIDGFPMTRASDGRFHYVTEYTGSIEHVDPDVILFYMSDGTTEGEQAGILYPVNNYDPNFKDILKAHSKQLFREIIRDVGRHEEKIGAYYTDLDKRLTNSTTMNITVGAKPYDRSTFDQYGTRYDATKLESIYKNGDPDQGINKTINPKVPLTGAQTIVPIVVDIDGSDTLTFYAVVRKAALDQYLDYIKVDEKSLTLDRDPDDPDHLVARTIVYSNDRRARVDIGASDPTANIQMLRPAGYNKYDSDGNIIGTETEEQSWMASGQLLTLVDNLNDGDNEFRVLVKSSNSSMPLNEYKLIIHYVNVALYLDPTDYDNSGKNGLVIYKGTDPDNDRVGQNTLDVSMTPSYVRTTLDYYFDVQNNPQNTVLLEARAYMAEKELQEDRKQYHIDELRSEKYEEIYDLEYAKVAAANPYATPKDLDKWTIENINKNLMYKKQIDDYPKEIIFVNGIQMTRLDEAMLDERIVVWSGNANDPQAVEDAIQHYHASDAAKAQNGGRENPELFRTANNTAVNPAGTTAVVEDIVFNTNVTGDFIRIPVNLTVIDTRFTRTYELTYHKLSDDATADWGVVGLDPDLTEGNKKTYEVNYATDALDIFAEANHKHLNATTTIVLWQVVGTNRVHLATSEKGAYDLYHDVALNVGMNTFEFQVVAETGNTETYTIIINRAVASLGLEWVRVDGNNATDNGDKTYTAYVTADTPLEAIQHTVTASPIDTKEGIIHISANYDKTTGQPGNVNYNWPSTGIADPTYGSAYAPIENAKKGIIGKLDNVETNSQVLDSYTITETLLDGTQVNTLVIPVKIRVKVLHTSEVTLKGVQQMDTTVIKEPPASQTSGPWTRTKLKYTVTGENTYTLETTVETWDEYILNIIPTDREALEVYVDTSDFGLFEQANWGKTYRRADWVNTEWTDDWSKQGAYVVGVPKGATEAMIRTRTNGVKTGYTAAQQMIRYEGFLAQNNDIDVPMRFTIQKAKVLDMKGGINKDTKVPYTSVEITVGYSYDQTDFGDNGTTYELHIYEYDDTAFLCNLDAYGLDENGAIDTSNKLSFSPPFISNKLANTDPTQGDPNNGKNEFFLYVKWDQATIAFDEIMAVKDATIKAVYPNGNEAIIPNDGTGRMMPVPLDNIYTLVRFTVISQDGLHKREYKVYIIREFDENTAMLKDIQIIHPGEGGKAEYYDLAPVFHPDPSVGAYYFAIPSDWEQMTINAVPYKDRPGVTYTVSHTVEGYNSNGTSTVPDAIGAGGNLISLTGLDQKSNYTYHVTLTVTKTQNNTATYTSTYHLYLHKNVDAEIENMPLPKHSLLTGMIVNGNIDVTRTTERYIADQNYYYTTDDQQINLALGLMSNSGWKTYLIETHKAPIIGTTSTDIEPTTKELRRTEVKPADLLGMTLTLSGERNQSRFLFEIETEKGNRYYTSLTVYREDVDETKLGDLRASEQITPIFDDDWFEYFVAVPADRKEVELNVRTKGSIGDSSLSANGIEIENIRIRDVGGRTLYDSIDESGNGSAGGEGNGAHWYTFPVDPGVNRVTITVAAKFRGIKTENIGGQSVNMPVVEHYLRAYEVELNRANYPENEVKIDEDKMEVVHIDHPDTGDIIEMDYTRGGRLAPIWNSDILNYTLAYGDETVGGKEVVLTPTMRELEITNLTIPDEKNTTYAPRGTFQVELVQIEHDGSRGPLQRIKSTHGYTFYSGEPVKLFLPTKDYGLKYEVTFITSVIGYDEVKYIQGGNVVKTEYREHETTKRYTVMIFVSQNTGVDLPELTVDDHHIGLGVYEYSEKANQYPLTPSFTEDFNAYYTEVPYVVDQVKLRVDAIYEIISGGNTTSYPYNITINNKPAVSGDYFPVENLAIGDNEFIITLSDIKENRKTYTLIINRKDITTRFDDYVEPFIVDMHVFDAATGGGAEVNMIPLYNQGVKFYNVVVPYAVDKVNLKATSKYADILGMNNILFDGADANYEITGERLLNLKVGHENFYEVIAYKTGPDGLPTGTKIRYIINVLRLADGYVEPLLDYLGVSEGTMSPVFDRSHNNYYVTVPYDVDNLDVIAEGILNESVVVVTDPHGGATSPQTKVIKNVKVDVGRTLVWIYIYDVRVNGDPYYKGVYSLTIDRVPKDGMSLDVGLNKQKRDSNAAAPTGSPMYKAISVWDSDGDELKFTTAAMASTVDIPGRLGNPSGFVNREMNYYVYVEDGESSVSMEVYSLSDDAVITVITPKGNKTPDASGKVQIDLSSTVDTVAIVEVKDPNKPNSSQRYSVTFIRRNKYVYIINDLAVTMGTKSEIATKGTKPFYTLSTNMYRDYDVTEDMKLDKDGNGNVTIEMTVPIYAEWSPDPVNNMPAVTWETTVTVNGHRASIIPGSIKDNDKIPGAKQARYTITLPVTTYEERFDIRVWIPAKRNGDGSYANANDKDSVEEFILYAYDNSSHLDERLLEIETDSYGMAVRDEDGNPVPALFDVVGSKTKVNKGITKPTLGRLSILENVDGKKVNTNTLTTRFERNVFHYEATVSDTSAAGTTPTKFYLAASTLTKAEEDAMIKQQRDEYIADLVKNSGMTQSQAEAHAKDHFVGQIELNAYIEVYDEDGYRQTVTNKTNDLEFEFPMIEQEDGSKVQADKMDILIRVTEFAESGHEVISEYTITVYRTEAPILRDLETRKYNKKMTPAYDPVIRYYESEVYDQKKDFNVWALADYGVGYRNAKLSMTAYKTQTAANPGDMGEIGGFLYTDPLTITSVSDANGPVAVSDLLTAGNVTTWNGSVGVSGTTSTSKTPVINNFYDQNDPQFGVRDTDSYVNEFWVVVELSYTVGTENHQGFYVVHVIRSRIPVVEGLIDLKAFESKAPMGSTEENYNEMLLYRVKTDPRNRTDLMTNETGTADYHMGMLDPYNATYDAQNNPIYPEKVLNKPDHPITKFEQQHPYYMVVMDYTDSRLFPWIEFESDEIKSVTMKVTYEGMLKDTTQTPVTYTMQIVNNAFNGKVMNNNMPNKQRVGLDFADDYYKNETFQAHIEFEVYDKSGTLMSTYHLLAVRGMRADDEEADFSLLSVYPGGSEKEVEENQQAGKNAATLTRGIDDITGHTHADYNNDKGYENTVKYYTVYGRTMADKWVNIDTKDMFPKSEMLRVTYHGMSKETKIIYDGTSNAQRANISIVLEDGETESWIFVTGRRKDNNGGDEYDCTYVIKIIRENTGKLDRIWIDDYKEGSSASDGDNRYIESGNKNNSDYRYKFLWKGTGNERYGAPYETLKNYYGKSYPEEQKLVWSPSNPSTDKDKGEGTNVKDNPYDFDNGYYNYSVFVDTLTSEMRIAARAPSTATLEIYQVDPKTKVNHRVASNNKSLGLGSVKTENGMDTLSKLVYLDTGLNGEDKFMVLVKESEDKVGVYWITVYRDTLGEKAPKFQLWINGTTSAAAGEDRAAQVQLYKKSDAMGYQSVMEATSGTNPLVKVTPANGTTPTYRERFNALTTGTNPQLKLVTNGTQFTAPSDGEYEFTPSDIGGVGTYMLVMSRPGYLDTVIDNIRVYETFTPAQYKFSNRNMRAGDVNGDGVVDQDDVDLFNKYSSAMNGIYREMACRLLVQNTKITTDGWNNSQNSGDNFDVSGLKVEYNLDENTAEDLIDKADDYGTTFYYSEKDFDINDTVGSADGSDAVMKELLENSPILKPGTPIPDVKKNDSGNTGKGYLYVAYTYKSLMALLKVDTFWIDQSDTPPAAPEVPTTPETPSNAYKKSSDVVIYKIFTEDNEDSETSGIMTMVEKSNEAEESSKKLSEFGKSVSTSMDAYKNDSDTVIHEVTDKDESKDKDKEDSTKPEASPELTETQLLIFEVVDAIQANMAAQKLSLSDSKITSAAQLVFSTLSTKGTSAPTWPTTLPGILDYDKNGYLTVVDYDYIMSYFDRRVEKLCTTDNNTARDRKGMTPHTGS